MSVDLPLGHFGGGYPLFKAPLYRSFARVGQSIELVRADSHASEKRLSTSGNRLPDDPLIFCSSTVITLTKA